MGIYDGYEDLNLIKNTQDSWEGKSGKDVEDFISRRLKNPVGSMLYRNNVLTLYNYDGLEITNTEVTVAPAEYNGDISFEQIVIGDSTYTSNLEFNYSDSKIYAGIIVHNYYTITGLTYDLTSPINLVFSIEGTTYQYVVKGVVPNKYTDNTIQFIDITKLLQQRLQGATVKVSFTTDEISREAVYGGTVTIHKIDLSTTVTHSSTQTIGFNIEGLTSSASGMKLFYYDIPLGTNIDNSTTIRPYLLDISSDNLSYVEIHLGIGCHQVLARVSNDNETFYSNWVLANVISYSDSNKLPAMAIVSNIPETINNCENAPLFQITVVPGTGGLIEVVSYISDDAGVFNEDLSAWPEFNKFSISTTAEDAPSNQTYYTYVELENVNNNSKTAAFSIKMGDSYYTLQRLLITNGRLYARKTFSISIIENPYNVNGCFNYTKGSILDYSQITGQSTTVFDGVNPAIEASDGWVIDSNRVAYKVSGQNTELFTLPKDLSSLLASNSGFTIEVMLKNYNVNNDDPVMSIGNLIFGPGYARINSVSLEIFVNSRADFEKDEITHLMFVYDPAYKPDTYNNVYDLLFNEDGVTYSSFLYTYPILKVFVNGTINREIEIKPNDLKTSDGFKWQVHPKSSDINFYIFRTYNKAFNYNEILKNAISALASSEEKKAYYDRNNILDSNGRVSFYKTLLNNNVIVMVLPENDKPLYFGNRKTNGDGIDPNNPEEDSKATLLVHYKNRDYSNFSGRFTEGKYKAQGSSAKKYMIHNVQYSKGKFISEADIAAGKTETSSTYAMPTDKENILAKKFVGKVNYASSMQSHKLGSVKLFDAAYKQAVFPNNYSEKLYSGGKKACLEEAFVYFYYNLKPGLDLNTITINDLYTTEVINGITVPHDSDVKFFGFQTWGSAKTDDPTYGYGDNTPEYLLVEGADNGAAGANFKQPWAAFLTWDPTVKYDNLKDKPVTQQPKSVTDPTSKTYDPTAGILLDGETIKFDSNGTDPWDIDYGLTELDEPNDLWKFTDAVKAPGSSLYHFVDFYNNCYAYDFTNLKAAEIVKVDLKNTFNVFSKTDSLGNDVTQYRLYMPNDKVSLVNSEGIGIGSANIFDVLRWDSRINQWVHGGLHYDNGSWETFNLATVYGELPTTYLYDKYIKGSEIEDQFGYAIQDLGDIEIRIIPAFLTIFKCNIEEYCDKDDIIYHQAFIRLVSGTDNRAKNTYFQIIGKLYEKNEETGVFEKTDTGDYKIRLMLDDLDTIFATDNNGQQVKPYYLLEPAFNKDTENMWGDHHNSFFYPFDVCYHEEINSVLGKLIDFLVGNSVTIKNKSSVLYDYFFKTLLDFPEILYNHHAEIYYEMPQSLFKEGTINAFNATLNSFTNNNVLQPLSLSHGRCIESEYQFMKDRLLLLGTQSNSAHGLYGSEWLLSTEDTGGNNGSTEFEGIATYTDYLYPTKRFNRSNLDEFAKLVNLDNNEITINFDPIFTHTEYGGKAPSIIASLVTPNNEYTLKTTVDTTIASYMSSAHKIKSLEVNTGLRAMHYLPKLPNAKILVIDGATSEYTVDLTDIAVKDYLPIIEELRITNTSFANTVLDFRLCNRLRVIDLRGCTNILNIILPESNRFEEVYMPSGIKSLTIGKTPNLRVLEFAESGVLTNISLNFSLLNNYIDHIDLLTNKLDMNNLESFVLTGDESSELTINESLAMRIADIAINESISSYISGKFVIKSGNNLTDISYNTKKQLVKAFGNIDSNQNSVHFLYTHSTLKYNSYKLPLLISIDVPESGITTKPFDSLTFTSGNNVGITQDGILNIKYSISNLPSGCSLNQTTGELTIKENTRDYYNYSITVYLENGSKLDSITGQIYFGYIEPLIGDYAYSDGTFSSVKDSDKTLVGIVFQKETVSSGNTWKLGILSNLTVTGYAGPDYYNQNYNSGFLIGSELGLIYNFLTHSEGLGITMNEPTASGYLGFSDSFNKSTNIITLSGSLPTTLVESGKTKSEKLANVGKTRLMQYALKNPSLMTYLKDLGVVNSQDELITTSLTITKLLNVFEKFNECVEDNNFGTANYSKVLHPLAFLVSQFQPNDVTKLDYYSKGCWYIPSVKELELIIWLRIKSFATSTVLVQASYWNATSGNGDSIFTNKTTDFLKFLNSTMLAAEVDHADNKNVIYGLKYYYDGSNYDVIQYGWFSDYNTDNYYDNYNHSSCRRDMSYTIAPVCVVTVTKPS